MKIIPTLIAFSLPLCATLAQGPKWYGAEDTGRYYRDGINAPRAQLVQLPAPRAQLVQSSPTGSRRQVIELTNEELQVYVPWLRVLAFNLADIVEMRWPDNLPL